VREKAVLRRLFTPISPEPEGAYNRWIAVFGNDISIISKLRTGMFGLCWWIAVFGLDPSIISRLRRRMLDH
jgi:hypothetical protein